MTNIDWKIKTFSELNTTELYEIIKARVNVFVVEQDCPYPDLDDYDQKAIHLSYGQRQRIAVIRALCQPFDFLLLDEPFSHLDDVNQQLLIDLVTEEAAKNKAGIIFTSLHEIHDKRLANVIQL